MKRRIGGIHMPLIEEDCFYLRQCLAAEGDNSTDMVPGSEETESEGRDSAWKDYKRCRRLGSGIMAYEFDTPMELAGILKKLWEGDFSEGFILAFLAAACKWGSTPMSDGAEDGEETDIPTYIYNF